MTTAALITAVYDNYDPLKPVPGQDMVHEQICVTDNPTLQCDGWTMVYEPRPDTHPNRAAKRPKCTPWEYTNADYVIWIDASFKVTSSFLVSELVSRFCPLGQFTHPDRDCIYREGSYSTGLRKYGGEPIDEQMDYYRQLGHPQHWGLWATGLIVRQRTPEIEAFGKAWLTECERSFQDQVSEAPMLREFGLRPTTLPGDYTRNDWVIYEGSSRH